MKASDLLIKALENEGVQYIFGIPGEENLDFLESLRESNIELILTRHEQAAGFMAATVGRLTGKAGVCLSTLGPGATNFVTAAAYAQLGAMPMMMITGQKPIKKSKQGRFQIVDIVEMMKPLTQFTRQVVDANKVPGLVREAIRIAEEERPGAVHIELPEDVAAEEGESTPYEINEVRRPGADKRAIDRAAEMICAAERPLILIGAAANRYRTSKALTELINAVQLPFFCTQMGKGVVDERNELCLGTAALSDHDYLHCAIDQADLIVNVGHDVIEKPPFFMEKGGKKVIHINYFSAEVDDVYFPQLEVVGDIAGSVKQLNVALSNKTESWWKGDYHKRIRNEIEEHVNDKADAESFPVIPQRLVADVRSVMPSDGIIALDNGMYKIWFARNYKAHQPNTVLLDNALATMGAGLPSAMAAKLIHPERKVLAICGDGGFMMNSQELETCVRLKLDISVLILRDDGYGMIKWKQASMGFKDYGLDYQNPDFVKYAESYGAVGHRVGSVNELSDTLEKTLCSPGVHVVELPIDYSENQRVLIDELQKKTCLL